MKIDAEGLHYQVLNRQIHAAMESGIKEFMLDNVKGQRYIGAGLSNGLRITINGVPGNDLGAFMNGTQIVVNGNGQDGVGNTMNSGKIVIHGDAGDILGYSMRGGKIFVRGSVGYRAGIHMKAYEDRFPIVVIGRSAADYLGEYMAGGVIAVLGLDQCGAPAVGEYIGTGMHGGVVYVRGNVEPYQVGREVGIDKLDDADWNALSRILTDYCHDFALRVADLCPDDFLKLTPRTSRPYGTLYAY